MRREQIRAQFDGYLSQGKVNKCPPTTVQITELKIHTGNRITLSNGSLFLLKSSKQKPFVNYYYKIPAFYKIA